MAAMQRKTGLRAEAPVPKQDKPQTAAKTQEHAASDELFTAEMRQQLDTVFGRMEKPLLLKLHLDSRPVSAELEHFITTLAALSDKLDSEVSDRQANENIAPCVEVCFADGTPTGLAFHGVPGGHEFTSFVLGLYNAAGPGQSLDPDIQEAIAQINQPTDMKILVTLSCTMCPDLVAAAQRIAASNPHVRAHVYDIRHFEDLKNRYKVMSVPCLVVGDEKVVFGKKNIREILDMIQS